MMSIEEFIVRTLVNAAIHQRINSFGWRFALLRQQQEAFGLGKLRAQPRSLDQMESL